MKLPAKRTLLTALAAVCLSTQLTACIETAIIGAVAASAIVLSDRRSISTYSKDAWIDIQAATPLSEIGSTKNTHIIANAFNGRVLLTGEVASAADKQKATDVVKAISGVKGVDNQLVVGPVTSLEVRNNDSFITSKVKSRLLGDSPELGNAMKIVTENGVVYVFGMLTQSELERGVEIVRNTAGDAADNPGRQLNTGQQERARKGPPTHTGRHPQIRPRATTGPRPRIRHSGGPAVPPHRLPECGSPDPGPGH